MMEPTYLIIGGAVVCAFICVMIADTYHARSAWPYALLGLVLGPIGVIVTAIMARPTD